MRMKTRALECSNIVQSQANSSAIDPPIHVSLVRALPVFPVEFACYSLLILAFTGRTSYQSNIGSPT